ncbi:MAG: AAA family ATPase, partial [Oscillospiraceae bacterium]|nr:AAA family ATPase [Oscillospiraceae bacterium]
MRIDSLCLYDWRSYAHARAEFAPGVNLLVGDNAQGKTNLLEAVVYLSQGQSFRTRAQAELVRIGAEFADLQAQISSQEREQNPRAVIFAARRPRQLYVGGVRKKSAA